MDWQSRPRKWPSPAICGIDLDLVPLRKAAGIDDPAILLFSESNTRFLIEVPPSRRSEFEGLFKNLPAVLVGHVTDDGRLRVSDEGDAHLIDSSLIDLKQAWKSPLAWD